jgi:hypothetical protein
MSQFNSDRNPDRLAMSKDNLLKVTDKLCQRWMKNKASNWKYIIEAWAIKKFFTSIPEEEYDYYWKEFWRLADELRTTNELRADDNPRVKLLADIQEAKLEKEILTVTAEKEKNIRVDFTKSLRFGALKDA